MNKLLNIFDLPEAAPQSEPQASTRQAENTDHIMWTSKDGEIIDLTIWVAMYGHRFQLVNVLKKRAPGIFTPRVKGVKYHIHCPHSGDHFTGGADDSGTVAVNAGDFAAAGFSKLRLGFIIHCSHNACKRRDRLDQITAMLNDGSLVIEDLTNEEFLTDDGPDIDFDRFFDEADAKRNEHKQPISASNDEWSIPEPLPSLPAVPAFDMSLLPDKFARYVGDVSDRARFAPDFAAVTLMVGFGSFVGRRIGVRLKQNDDWTEYANVWGMSVGLPSALKSPAMRAALSPLKRLQAGLDEKSDAAALVHKGALELTKICNEAAKKKAKASLDDDEKPTLVLEAEPPSPPRRVLVTSDVTVEKLGELLKDNPNGLLIERDELSSWLTNLEDERNATARGFFLSGWSGQEGYRFDRIMRGTTAIPAFALSVVGGIQPGPLERYVRGALSGERADGLLQRFQLAVWPESPSFEYIDRWPDKTAKSDLFELFKVTDSFDPMSIGTADNFGHNPPHIHLDRSAQGLFTEWFTDFMTTRRNREANGDESLALASHFGKYTGLLGKLALIIHLADYPTDKEISERTLLKALAWLEYLTPHAHRIYHGASAPDADAARLLLARIKRGSVKTPFSAREVYRNGWHGLGDAAKVKSACSVLVDYGYLRETEIDPPTNGRPSDPLYHVNPNMPV